MHAEVKSVHVLPLCKNTVFNQSIHPYTVWSYRAIYIYTTILSVVFIPKHPGIIYNNIQNLILI